MKKALTPEAEEEIRVRDFFDRITPGVIRFYRSSYLMGDSWRCVWALREYPPSTQTQALLAQLASHNGVTLHIYHRPVDAAEQNKILQNANLKNQMMAQDKNVTTSVAAQEELAGVVTLVQKLQNEREPLLHVSVYLELTASSAKALNELQTEIYMELTRCGLSVDRLTLRQKEGFLSVAPFGSSRFADQFERVLPASSAANLYPFSYSGKTDPHGIYIGRDKFGTNILVDLDRRTSDKTNPSVLILGNSGEGKSYLLKLLLTNLRESGKRVICLDPDAEYAELCQNLGGCCVDLLSGEFIINPLEPRAWTAAPVSDTDAPEAFRRATPLSQHIAWLKDFFRSYRDFSDAHIDVIEILLLKLYARFGITDSTVYSTKKPSDFPTMSDFYALCEEEYKAYDRERKNVFTEEQLQQLCLGLRSMCVGAESRYFNGHTNITDDAFLVFVVKGLIDTNRSLKNAMLFNILSYMNHQLLEQGNTAAAIDELYLFLNNPTAIEYIRNAMKRGRKVESSMILASQNPEDFLLPGIREYTKPMFAIPTHQFLFHPGRISQAEYKDVLQVADCEFARIRDPSQGVCLYRCGNERYWLKVIAPSYKSALFGKAGGR